MAKNDVVVVTGVRTPFCKARTVFKGIPASTLGAVVLRETVLRSGLEPKFIDELYFGIVSPPAEGTHVAREALFDSGLPPEIPCTTVNRYCASAAEAVGAITAKLQSGQISFGLAGGVESISSVCAVFSEEASDYFQTLGSLKTTLDKIKHLAKLKPEFFKPLAPGIKEPTTGLTMGQSADLMSRVFQVTRIRQDEYALESHQKTYDAWQKGFYQNHVVPVNTISGKTISQDPDIRKDTSLEKLSKLKPVFYKDGTITAGNASSLTDGASCCLLTTDEKASEFHLPKLGKIRAVSAAAIDLKKEPLLIAPAFAIPKVLKAAGISWKDIDLIEMHEAFAGQVLSTVDAIESASFAKQKLFLDQPIGQVDMKKLNVNGGSIAIGHPFGATGVRLILQALHELRARNKNIALLTVCAAGGLGMALVVEAI